MGKRKHSEGYIWLNKDGKCVLEHRDIIEKHIGRRLKTNEVIHHKDGNKENNNINNLELMSVQQHTILHRPEAKTKDMVCTHCKKQYTILLGYYTYRKKKGQLFFCSKQCAGKMAIPPQQKKSEKIWEIVKKGLNDGKTGYQIAKENGLNRKTVYNQINGHIAKSG